MWPFEPSTRGRPSTFPSATARAKPAFVRAMSVSLPHSKTCLRGLRFRFLRGPDSRVFLAVGLKGVPNIDSFLHPYQELGTDIEHAGESICHIHAQAPLFGQHFIDGSPGNSDRICEFALAQTELRQKLFADKFAWMRRASLSPIQNVCHQ